MYVCVFVLFAYMTILVVHVSVLRMFGKRCVCVCCVCDSCCGFVVCLCTVSAQLYSVWRLCMSDIGVCAYCVLRAFMNLFYICV